MFNFGGPSPYQGGTVCSLAVQSRCAVYIYGDIPIYGDGDIPIYRGLAVQSRCAVYIHLILEAHLHIRGAHPHICRLHT